MRTFEQFCDDWRVTPAERADLRALLAIMRATNPTAVVGRYLLALGSQE